MNRPTKTLTVVAIVATSAIVLTSCSSGSNNTSSPPSDATSTSSPGSSQTPASTSAPSYHVTIDPANFTTKIDHPYFPLKPGTTRLFKGTRDGAPHDTEVVVTHRTRTVMGVTCVVVEDTVTSNGALVEKTEDWYAQDKEGTVWYFGENTAEYVNGAVSSTHGSWEAGVDNAQPGVIMHAQPKVGEEYYQEYRPGEAEDRARILTDNTRVHVPFGSFSHVITTKDSDPLNPDKTDRKWYAPGVGIVHSIRIMSDHHEEMSLVDVTKP